MGQRLRTVNRQLVSYLGAPQQYRSGAQAAGSEAGASTLYSSLAGHGSMLHLPSRAATAASLSLHPGLTLAQGSVSAAAGGLGGTLPQLSMHGSYSGQRAAGLGTVVTELDGWPGGPGGPGQQQQQQVAGGHGQVHAGHHQGGGAGAPEALLGGDLKLHVLQAHDLAVREGPHVEVYARWGAAWLGCACAVGMYLMTCQHVCGCVNLSIC